MKHLPKSFINEALKEVRMELTSNLRHGGRLSDDYYFTLAADCIWIATVSWKCQDSCFTEPKSLSLKDIEYGCRQRGIHIEWDNTDLKVMLPNHTYVFTETFSYTFGGPADASGHYQGYCFADGALMMSMRSFFRILEWFDGEIDLAYEEVIRAVEESCAAFKIVQIKEATLQTLLGPGLENVDYGLRCLGGRVVAEVRLGPDRPESMSDIEAVRLRFKYDEIIGNVALYRNIILRLNEHPENWESCRELFSATVLHTDEYAPLDDEWDDGPFAAL